MSNSGIKKFSEKDLMGLFSEEDLEVPHNDALVVSMTVGNTQLDKIVVSNGFVPNVLYLSTLDKTLELSLSDVRPEQKTMFGNLIGAKARVTGDYKLPVTAGDRPNFRTVMVDFLVTDYPSSYDVVFGCERLSALGAVPSTYHQVMRFPTKAGIGLVRGDQKKARECENSRLF